MWCFDVVGLILRVYVVVLVALMVSCEVMDDGGVGCKALMGVSSGMAVGYGGFFYFVFL